MLAGDQMKVTLAIDAQPRTIIFPKDLKQALVKNSPAEKYFYALAFSRQKEYVNWITEAKREDSCERRLRKTLQQLNEQI